MGLQIFNPKNAKPFVIPAAIVATAAFALAANGWGLAQGITSVFPHLFYIPIILAAYFYPRRGLVVAAGLSLLYFFEVTLAIPVSSDLYIAAAARVIVFIVIAGIISWLSASMQADARVCQRLVSMVRSSNDAIIGKTLDGIITDWNDGARDLYGYTAREVIGRSISLIVPEDRHPEIADFLEKIRNGQRVERYETERLTRDGKRIRVSLSISPIKNEQGEIIGASSSTHDITAQTEMQDQILRAKTEWELTFNAVPDMIAIIDRNHRIVRVNQSMAARLGMPPETIVGKACFQLVHRHSEPLEVCPHSRLLADGEAHSTEIHEELLNGDFQVTVSPLHTPQGDLVGSVHILHDITESKRAQNEIENRERFLNRLLETINNPIFYKKTDGIFLGCNSAFERYIGFSRNQIVGKTVYDLAPRDLADIYTQKDAELFAAPGSQMYESQVRYADGTLRDVIFNKATFTDRDGKVEGLVGVILDITDRKQWEVSLQQANKKLNMLSSITRHDILNQLMGLRAFLELSREIVTEPEIQEYISKEEQAAEAIHRQIEFTRYYQDIGVQVPKWQNLKDLVRGAVSQLNLSAIHLEIDLPDIEVYADPLIEKVFYNLFENSLRHGGGVTRIALHGEPAPDGMQVIYSDNGVGISAEDKGRLFQKGFGKNTGLGLFLSREILSITGLIITEAGSPGSGVRFVITLPKGTCRRTVGSSGE